MDQDKNIPLQLIRLSLLLLDMRLAFKATFSNPELVTC